jgi:hypothetical protein
MLLYEGLKAFNPLNAKINPICHLLALLGAHPILHISRIKVNFISLTMLHFSAASTGSQVRSAANR